MKTCPNCMSPLDDNMRYCLSCGAEQPVEEAAAAPSPVSYAPPTPTPSKGKAIVGMALSIGGMAYGVIGVFFTALFMILSHIDYDIELFGMYSIVYGFLFLLCALPLSIVGLCLSQKSIAQGATWPMCRLGKLFGWIGLGLCALLLILAIAATVSFVQATSDPYSYYFY